MAHKYEDKVWHWYATETSSRTWLHYLAVKRTKQRAVVQSPSSRRHIRSSRNGNRIICLLQDKFRSTTLKPIIHTQTPHADTVTHDTVQPDSQTTFRRLTRGELNLSLTAHLTSNVEKNPRVPSETFSAKIAASVSFTVFLSDLDRLVLSFSRAETCFTLRVKEEKHRLKKKKKIIKDQKSEEIIPSLHHCGMSEEFQFRSDEESESRNVTHSSRLAAIIVACNHERDSWEKWLWKMWVVVQTVPLINFLHRLEWT